MASAVTYAYSSGQWHAINFNSNNAWAKFSGVWLDMSTNSRKIHVKDGGSWIEAFPSELSAWTAYQTGSIASQGSSADPNFSTNPSYTYTNIATASDPVGWDGRASFGSTGQKAKIQDFNWIEDIPGVGHGAVDRIRVTYSQKYIDAPGSGNFLRTGTGFGNNPGIANSPMTASYVVVTRDRPAGSAGWQLSDSDVSRLFDGIENAWIAGSYDNASDPSDKESIIKSFQVGLHYYYN